MDPNAEAPVNPGGVATTEPTVPGTSSILTPPKPLSGLEDVVAAAEEAARIAGTPTVTPTPREQFSAQFGSGATPTVVETPVLTDVKPPFTKVPAGAPSVAPLDPSIKTAEDLLKEVPQVVGNPDPVAEAALQPEQTPKEKLMEKISKIVDEYSVGEVREKAAV